MIDRSHHSNASRDMRKSEIHGVVLASQSASELSTERAADAKLSGMVEQANVTNATNLHTTYKP